MAISVTLSSAGTATIPLNPVPKSTTVIAAVGTTGSTGTFQVDFTVDDLQITPAAQVQWALLSSVATMLTSNVGSLVWTVLSPIGGVRLNSAANPSSVNTLTLKALQSVTA